MTVSKTKRNIVLGILFFLPVAFLLMLYPATHNYQPLDIVHEGVYDIDKFTSVDGNSIQLKDHITLLAFVGKKPLNNAIAALNLKELVYEKFKGFKKFQVVIVVEESGREEILPLKSEINSYEEPKFWYFVTGNETGITQLFNSLKSSSTLREDLSTDEIFIIDKDLNQRGRIDGRDKKEIEANKPVYSLVSYNAIDIDDIKNKMSEDMRILFTEYRQKRKGRFDDSSTRRAQDLKLDNE